MPSGSVEIIPPDNISIRGANVIQIVTQGVPSTSDGDGVRKYLMEL